MYKSARTWEFILVALLIIGAAYFTIPSTLAIITPENSQHSLIPKSDFIIFYSDAQIAISDNFRKIYDLNLQGEFQTQNIGARELHVTPYLYPPYSMAFFAPLALFPLKQAFNIWYYFNALFTFLLLTALYYAGICKKPGSVLVATLLIITSNLWIGIMANGQTTILMTAGILGCQLLAKHKHTVLAGLLLALTAFKPQLIFAPALYLLIIYGSALWVSAGCSALAVVGICSAVFGFSIWHDYINSMLGVSQLFQMGYGVMQMCNIRTLALLFFGETHFDFINRLSTGLWLISIAVTCWIAFKLRNKADVQQELGFSLSIAIACFFSPYLFSNSLIFLVISVGYLIKHTSIRSLYPVGAGMIMLNYAAITFPAEANPLIWVPVQFLLIGWIAIVLFKRNSTLETAKI